MELVLTPVADDVCVAPQLDPAAMKALLKTLIDNGGRVVDVMHGGPAGEDAARMQRLLERRGQLRLQPLPVLAQEGLAVAGAGPLRQGQPHPALRYDQAHAPRARIKARRRFVQHQNLRLHRKHCGNGNALLLAHAQQPRIALALVFRHVERNAEQIGRGYRAGDGYDVDGTEEEQDEEID